MAVKVGGTDPGAEHDLAIPFECVGALLRKYRDRDPDKIALVDLDQDKSITFGQMHDEVNRIARRLAAMGVGKGDKLFIVHTPDGIRLTPYDPNFARVMEASRGFMRSHRDTLRELAK